MAFIVVDPDDSSFITEESYLGGPGQGRNPTFRHMSSVMAQRNLYSDFECDSASSTQLLLPVPSEKETIQVYLRVKPKTPEESQISSSSSLGGAATSESPNATKEETELINIESEHQVRGGPMDQDDLISSVTPRPS